MAQIVTRFAPSPTGHLHIGGARSALFCWAYARRARLDGHDGRFMIRIEDTDQARSSDESARGILEDLAWLGIEWDDGPELRGQGSGVRGQGETIGGDPRGVGPYFSARRTEHYNRHIDQLIASGRAYPSFETPEQLDAMRRDAAARKQTFRYDRSIMPMDERLRRMKAGEPHVVRFVAPADAVTVHDQVLGDVNYAAGEMDDFVIRKADGLPTYHFAVVVDDELMGVTHVMRAQEHLSNTPRHVALQRAMKRHDTGAPFRTPVYAHMPLIFNMDGSKMSKRDKAKTAREFLKAVLDHLEQRASSPVMPKFQAVLQRISGKAENEVTSAIFAALDEQQDPQHPADPTIRRIEVETFRHGDSDSIAVANAVKKVLGIELPEIEVSDFREAGYLPEAIVNFIALLGWSPGMKDDQGRDVEKFDRDFLAKHFSIDRIGRTNAKFDRVKLLSFNADAIAALGDADFVRRWREWCAEHDPRVNERLDEPRMLALAPAIKPRAKTLRDAAKAVQFAVTPDDAIEFDPKAVDKSLRKGDPTGLAVLAELKGVLAALPSLDASAAHSALESFASSKGLDMGRVAQPLRVALTGSGVSPPIDVTLAVLGKASVLARISRCLARITA